MYVVDMASSASSDSTATVWRRSSGQNCSKISRKKRWETAITVIGYCLDILPLFTKEETMGDCDNGNWLLFGHFATIYEGWNDG